ncbi:transposase within CP-933O; partial [Escherichia coli]|nr:transposase within CP-933O; partial [Escherichia coli]CAD5731295.1 transposase within CP-933O; partial [Escherichia coli]CAD5746584.1 transposase within CP-933O; partial [Escherichia coli]
MFLALGINIEGQKEQLGMWRAENEEAKSWFNVLTELKKRGLNDILIAFIDGLKGFPDAINTVYPESRIQLCIVHIVRNSLRFVSWKDYKAVIRDLEAIQGASQKWTMPLRDWRMAMSRFIIEFGDRLDSHF